MLVLVNFNPELSSQILEEAKAALVLYLCLLATEKKDIVLSFRQDSSVLTTTSTARSAAVRKAWFLGSLFDIEHSWSNDTC